MIGLATLAIAVLIAGIIAAAGRRSWQLGLWTQAVGVGVGACLAVAVLVSDEALGSAFVSGFHPSLGVDALSAFFLLVIAVTAIPVLIFTTAGIDGEPHRRALAVLTGAFLAAMALVVCARDISTFLAGWELMTLIPAIAILLHSAARSARRAVLVYLSITHLGGVGVWLVLIMLSDAGALTDPASFARQSIAFQWAIWVAAIIGFGVKAGLMPMHTWLPRAHPAAPAHFSALMSGVMLKVAIYGLIRVLFEWATPVPSSLAVVLLGIGALSAVGGVLLALFQREVKIVLAFSSIENAGIICLGLGAALLFTAGGQTLWASLAFAGALLHTLNHALFKSLLFLGSGAVARSTHGIGIDRLGGLIRRMPWTGAFFVLGALAIAGVPPLNGFVSEWLTLQSLIHIGLDGAPVPWLGPVAAVALAVTAALAALCFVKVVGLMFLSRPRTPTAASATEVGWQMKLGQGLLAVMCVLMAVMPALLIPRLAALAPNTTGLNTGIDLDLPGTGGLPMPAIILTLVAGVGILGLFRRRKPTSAAAPTWSCGQAPDARLAWTSAAFSKPLRMSWDVALRPRREVVNRRSGGITVAVEYRGEVADTFETRVYEPAGDWLSKLFRRARRLQSGRLGNYAFHLLGLLGLLLLLARFGVGA